ncbi:hypothetical protein N7532_003462 [Penicillium argentinense]|uniref:Uncharacterized protein n=1 Tax=Penicillium argentinense TaxID=1131581 RepID=A0A9W9FMQ0_9EURO|nr:uncharacterized protein N7532_003462 [Penicillium argentinense]KAJ5102933.1 hypothetical protein N7532_003462 [Penicillium argentinense]
MSLGQSPTSARLGAVGTFTQIGGPVDTPWATFGGSTRAHGGWMYHVASEPLNRDSKNKGSEPGRPDFAVPADGGTAGLLVGQEISVGMSSRETPVSEDDGRAFFLVSSRCVVRAVDSLRGIVGEKWGVWSANLASAGLPFDLLLVVLPNCPDFPRDQSNHDRSGRSSEPTIVITGDSPGKVREGAQRCNDAKSGSHWWEREGRLQAPADRRSDRTMTGGGHDHVAGAGLDRGGFTASCPPCVQTWHRIISCLHRAPPVEVDVLGGLSWTLTKDGAD